MSTTALTELHKETVEANDSPQYDIFDLLYQQQTTVELIAETFQIQPTEDSSIVVERRSLTTNSLEIKVRASHSAQNISTSFHADAYLNAFIGKRLFRASGYIAVQDGFNPNLYLVFERSTRKSISNPTSIPKPQKEVSVDPITRKLSCSCPDYRKQLLLLPQHPDLWEYIQQQAVCKHIVATCIKYPKLVKAIDCLPCLELRQTVQISQTKMKVKAAMQRQHLEQMKRVVRPFEPAIARVDPKCPNILEGLGEVVFDTLYNTTLVPEAWGCGQEEFEIMRSTLHYFWHRLKPQERLEELMRLVLELGLPDFFPSPPHVIEFMLQFCRLKPGMRVLECAAGRGDVAIALLEEEPELLLDVIEVQPLLREILRLRGFEVLDHEFLSYAENTTDKYDLIITNPSFRLDRAFLKAALPLLEPDGQVVMLVGDTALTSPELQFEEFREWLEEVGAKVHPLPRGAFVESDRPTEVHSSVVVVEAA